MLLLSRPMICSGQWSRTTANRRKLRLTSCGGRQSSVSPMNRKSPEMATDAILSPSTAWEMTRYMKTGDLRPRPGIYRPYAG